MNSNKSLEPNERRSAIVLIEFQREWLDPAEGRLERLMQDQNQLAESQRFASQALETARTARMHIIHVPCSFEPGYPELGGGQHFHLGLFAAIPKAGTWTGKGHAFAKGFEPRPGEFVVSGRIGASAFSHSNLDAYLRNNGITSLFLAGYALHVCVESTLRAAHDLGYEATVLQDACAAFNQAQRQHVLEEVVQHFGARMTVSAFRAALVARTESDAISR
ncbi:MAG: cysteine hydrolase [Terriglobia bacterium]